jgi:flagellar hook-associated protein FlgK
MSLSSAALTAQTGLNAITAEAAVLSRNITGANDTEIYSRKTANVHLSAWRLASRVNNPGVESSRLRQPAERNIR